MSTTRVLIVVLLGILLSVGLRPAAAFIMAPLLQEETYQEGFEAAVSSGYTISNRGLGIRATKVINGSDRFTEISLGYGAAAPYPTGTRFQALARLPQNPDDLERSNDLRRRELHTSLMMTDQVTGQSALVEIHINIQVNDGLGGERRL